MGRGQREVLLEIKERWTGQLVQAGRAGNRSRDEMYGLVTTVSWMLNLAVLQEVRAYSK